MIFNDEVYEIAKEGEMIKVDGFDDCIIGIGSKACQEDVLIYDEDKIIRKIMKLHKCKLIIAEEYYSFNIRNAYMGDKTPIFMSKIKGKVNLEKKD